MSIIYDKDGITIYHGDNRDVLPSLGQHDLLMTDPPFGIDAVPSFMKLCRWSCVWGGNYFSDVLDPTNDWLIWHKDNDGLSFSEAEMAWTNYGRQVRVLRHHWGREKKQHPTQKPLDVIKWAITMVPEDDIEIVLDPFMGSGTTLVAAKQMGLRAVGIEQSDEYCKVAIERLRQKVLF